MLSTVDFTWQTGMLSFSTYLFCSAEPPKFIKKPEALRFVKQGDTIQLECKISGTPEIRIVWYKNEQALQASDRLHMSFVDSVATLTILGATAEDAGDYICEAHNSAGTASCSTSVTVKGQHMAAHPSAAAVAAGCWASVSPAALAFKCC